MAFIGNTVQTQGFTPQIDYFNGNGSTVTFTLSRPVVSVAQMIVAIDNVIQNPSSAYTVSGSSITFTSAPLSGTNNIWVEYTSLITTYAALSQSPSVVGDITASGGYLAVGNFGASFVDGTIVDYVTGNGRITAGPADGITLYNGGTSARTALAAWDASGNLTNTGSIGSPAATALTLKSAGTTAVTIDTSQNVSIGTTTTSYGKFSVNGTINPLAGNKIQFQNSSNSNYSAIYNPSTDSGASLAFQNGGGTVISILSNGATIMGTATTENGQNSISFSNSSDTSSYGKAMLFNTQYSSTRNAVVFQYNSGTVGTIITSTTNTSYNTSSDYRLKDNPQPLTGSGAFIDALQPKTWTWKIDGSSGVGFLAHEAQEVFPQSVHGEKDAIDADGKPIIQSMEYGSAEFIANMVAELQDLRKRVAALEAK